MNTKKLFFFAIAALGLAACSNDEVVESFATSEANAISFHTNVNGTTRATSLNLASLESDGFYVTATYTTGHAAYFADQLFKENGTTWQPHTGTAYKFIYWPNKGDDILDFHAYAPATNAQLAVSNANVATENGCPAYTVIPAVGAADQVDFIYATLTGQDYQNDNMGLTFNHAESQISIKLNNSDSGLKITIGEIGLFNIAPSGIYKYRTSAMAWGDWGVTSTSYTQTVNVVQDGITAASVIGTSWILVPQQLAAPTTNGKYSGSDEGAGYQGAYIRVKMKVQSTANNSVYYAGGADSWVYAIWPISLKDSEFTWAKGYHYTYSIDLSGGGYNEGNVAETDDNLDRVLDLTPITFATVTVNDWIPYDGDGNSSADADEDGENENDPIIISMP